MNVSTLPKDLQKGLSIANLATHYTKNLGWGLVQLEPKSKGTYVTGWTTNPITDPAKLNRLGNIGLNHGYSQTAALDLDHMAAEMALTLVGIRLPDILAQAPYQIVGNPEKPPKPIFRVQPGIVLSRKVLTWPNPEGRLDKDGKIELDTIFELRGGPGLQDVLPPSIHPDTGHPYQWLDGKIPQKPEDIPYLPTELLALWLSWDEKQSLFVCPWAELAPGDRTPNKAPPPKHYDGNGFDPALVSDEFNRQHSPVEVIERHGYKPMGHKWLSPHSSTGNPGVILLGDGKKILSFHGSDPLGDGRPHDAFDCYAILDHGGNRSAAWHAAKDSLGIHFAGGPSPDRPGSKTDNDPPPDDLAAASLSLEDLFCVVKYSPTEDRPQALAALIDALAFEDPATVETYAQAVKELGFRTTKFDEAIRAKRKALNQERLESDDNQSWPYTVKQGQTILNTWQNGQLESLPVAAFVARITSEITSEYGDRWYGIEGKTALGRKFSLEIGNDDFASNAKLTAALTGAAGAKAPVMARMEPHLRPAIQLMTNGELKEITRFERTGWHDGKFLIPGREPDNVGILLEKDMPYCINAKADLEKGLKALNAMLYAIPLEYSLPIIVLAFQPALARLVGWDNERYAMFLTGKSGSFKTSFAQLLMAVWGAGFMRDDNLTKLGDGATTLAVMKIATKAHDLPLLIDNYKPNTGGGPKALIGLIHSLVEGGEKKRLTRSAELKESRPVFCWPIFTGEDVPDTDPASLARVLVCRFKDKKEDAIQKLTEAQSLAAHLCAIGGAWLDWLESDEGKKAAKEAKAQFAEKRNEWARYMNTHQPDAVNIMRLATNLATNELTYGVILKHPVLGKVFDSLKITHLIGLEKIANSMGIATAESLEGKRFLEALQALVNSKRVEITDKTKPIGWPEKHIGWRDDEGYYLVPDLAIAAVLDLNGKDYLNHISKNSLYSQLDDMGCISTKDDTGGKTTVLKRFGKTIGRFLHLTLETLDPVDDQDAQDPE